MIDFYFQKQDISKMESDIKSIYDSLNIDALKKELDELKKISHEPDFWNDIEKATSISKKITNNEKKIKKIEDLIKEIDNLNELILFVEEVNDEAEAENVKKEIIKVKKQVNEFSIEALLSGPYDLNNAILSIHAGAGGTEAQDWVEMLFRMYSRYADIRKYKINVLDKLDGDDAGIKSITFLVEGDYAYGYLKAEMGVHRLVR
nr:PCRF domain-containing protein [Clostridia bacterium]